MAKAFRNQTLRAVVVALYALIAGADQGLHYLSPGGSCHGSTADACCADGCRHAESPFLRWRDTQPCPADDGVQQLRSEAPQRLCADCVICQSLRQLVAQPTADSPALVACGLTTPALLGSPAQAELITLGVRAARGPPTPVTDC
ncbi:hypothetical protein KOR34_11890 [Posidoniimonas corsicana]|uniref:Uncharacterized protein n=1 Tax=Posidoniimonas corsicana TaxID=1938618 RepID=A0A5C5VF33_9BACT|nr:hypothetical protein [Posidoniimonas corsicana]TWT36285.1 hypothetical protein KOR34_11890 [Posidoniimonas corsicana]